jgi:hypothetical protein
MVTLRSPFDVRQHRDAEQAYGARLGGTGSVPVGRGMRTASEAGSDCKSEVSEWVPPSTFARPVLELIICCGG